MIKNVTAIVALAIAAPFAFELEAQATDYKNYPGALCVQTGTSTKTLTVSTSYGGAVYNNTTGTGSITVVCPIVRDEFESGFKSGSEVAVMDSNSSANISCQICYGTMSSGSHVSDCSSSYSSTTKGAGVQEVLTISDAATSLVIGTDDEYYYLQCSMPKSTYLIGYEIEEVD